MFDNNIIQIWLWSPIIYYWKIVLLHSRVFKSILPITQGLSKYSQLIMITCVLVIYKDDRANRDNILGAFS